METLNIITLVFLTVEGIFTLYVLTINHSTRREYLDGLLIRLALVACTASVYLLYLELLDYLYTLNLVVILSCIGLILLKISLLKIRNKEKHLNI